MAPGNKSKPDVVSDSRFQKVHNDPRFARVSKKKSKLQIDQRFAAVLKDDRFQAVQGKYDKYGRRIQNKSNELKKFYRLEEEDDDVDEKKKKKDTSDEEDDGDSSSKEDAKASSSSSDEEDEGEGEDNEKMSRLEYLNRMARGEISSDSEDSSSDEDMDAEDEEDAAKEKEDIPMGEETKRFAVLNCDWSRIRAVDLFALCQSFAPETGAVKDVTIYPSDYGLQKMKEEEQYGPRELWSDKKKEEEAASDDEDTEKSDDGEMEKEQPEKAEDDDDDQDVEEKNEEEDEDEDEDDEEEEDEEDDDPLGVKKSVQANEAEGFDQEKLRQYELQKLKYYYAVVTCDSVKTASAIYENCDQLEYETSSNLLDLRFIPDDMEFTNAPRESCQRVPETYKPTLFATRALQQTDVTLTWEEDNDQRHELLTHHSAWKSADDDDFAAYLASENSSSEGEDGEDESEAEQDASEGKKSKSKKAAKIKKLKQRYRKMLLGSDAEDSGDEDDDALSSAQEDSSGDEDNISGQDSDGASDEDEEAALSESGSEDEGADGDDADGNMEMTFTPGAGDILKAKRQKEREASETPFERYTREKKEEKNRKRHEKRKLQKQQARDQREQLKAAKGRGKDKAAAPESLRALREAIADDAASGSDDDRNFDMKKIAQSEKVKKLKGKRKAKELKKLQSKAASGMQEGFAFDAADPRFGALYEKGSQFQLDPTDPKFKKTEATQAIFQERRKRQSEQAVSGKKEAASKPKAEEPAAASSSSGLAAMVENLKRKAATQQSQRKAAPKPFKKPKLGR
ncbi:hypothetical protein P43SY_006961 [Pythium insidiosum]|uniref:NUC153 domain-containing protein n=1 Tax=Pythium insidiosum TaxID=114742 RepID=A0AAD5QBG0_PYTIN|nr:hypothetical protein P43SY_006961 [Pythium insidiosum]